MSSFTTRYMFPADTLPEGEMGGEEPCSDLSSSPTCSLLVVVCNAADTQVIDQ